MNKKQIIQNTILFVKETLEDAEGGHDWFHIERVYKNAILIAENEKLNAPNSKKLGFVRRIPSVREIAARAIFRYDEILLRKINRALGANIELVAGLNDFRKHYQLDMSISEHRALRFLSRPYLQIPCVVLGGGRPSVRPFNHGPGSWAHMDP